MSEQSPASPASRPAKSPLFSLVSAWALAFGCAVGWDAVTLPGAAFLPKAGPLGTVIGLLLGGFVMAVVARNFHFMINRHPGPGGVYSYATEAFGSDHGFICAWFLCLTYVAIVWADATALVIVARDILGDIFRFGFTYTVAGSEVSLGNILVSAAAISIAAYFCCRRHAAMVQTVLCFLFILTILASFGAACAVCPGGFRAMAPAFSPHPAAGHPVVQILAIVSICPWLFVGFESISNLSGEFRFPLRRSFAVMLAAIGTAIAAYVLLTFIPVFSPYGGAPDWATANASLGTAEFPAVDVVIRPLGRAAIPVLCLGLIAAVFTNLIGNTVAASRLLAAMADDGVLPAWFGRRNRLGAPRNAILGIAGLSLVVSVLGQTTLAVIVDISIVGVGIAYAYTSAATFKIALAAGRRLSAATGLVGLLLSLAISVAFVLPNVAADAFSTMATQSYLVVVLWCIAGLVFFLSVFRRDRERRFGQSTVVWIFLLAAILLLSLFWIRQSTYETTARAFDDIVRHHADVCIPAANGDATPDAHFSSDGIIHDHGPDVPCPYGDDWRGTLRHRLAAVNRAIVRNSLVQLGLTVLSFALMLYLFAVLRRRERELELEKARAKSYFFSTVSHDIRTPLNAIIGFSEMLQSGLPTPAERQQALDSIVVSGKTLLGLVNDVLDLSKLESGKMEILPEPTDCAGLLRDIMHTFRVAADKPHLDLRCHADPMPLLMLDPQRLRQIVFNLVGNAVKFTNRGHVELRASYNQHPGATTGLFRLEVEDTGCGLSDDDKRRIGTAYVQVGSSRARSGGTGLGLAICSQLAAAMGGSLSVVSALGRGSTFSVSIPDVETAAAPSSAHAHPDSDSAALPPALATPSAPVRRILLVDDSKVNLMVLRAHLKLLGDYDITLADDGQKALQILQSPTERPFDLVFTDLWMPNLDGEGLVRAIRADPKLSALRVVIVTADVELREKATSAGCDAILYKPVTAAKLAHLLSVTPKHGHS